MSTPHNSANPGDIAKTVLMPGDPLRAKYVAENFLDDVKLVSGVRNIYAYTGTYKGKPLSVMASGMGQPSIGIYSYELYKFYDVENIIRIGSAGAYTTDMDLYDVMLGDSAFSHSTFAKVMSGCEDQVMYPSKVINAAVRKASETTGIAVKTGRIHSSDVFYTEAGGTAYLEEVMQQGCACVEMESFALFHVANVLGKNAACILTISDILPTGMKASSEERQNAFTNMMKVALEAAILL